MANVQGTFYSATTQRRGVTPVSPPNSVDDPVDPVAPPIGSHPPVTIGTPANGLSIVPSSQVLSIGLASSGVTGALSGTDWNTFNGKLNLTSPITGYTVGSDTALTETDSILQAFGKVQGQIDARVSGSATSGQVAFWNGTSSITGDTAFTWDNVNKLLILNTGSEAIRFASGTALRTGVVSGSTFFFDLGDVTFRRGDGALVSARIGINATPTETLDVNGTARIRTVANATGNFVTLSATGVLQQRTAAEVRTDIGAEPSFSKGNLIAGTNITLSGTLSSRLVGSGDVTINATVSADTNKVSYNLSDSKTASERLQARVNIGSTSATPQIITTAGAINNLVVTSNHLVFTGDSVVLSGIVSGLDGEEITILNASGTNLELISESALSTVGNRFASGVIVPNLSILRIKYRTTSNRWFLENVGINDGRYVRKDVADTKTGNLTLSNGCIINGFLDVNGSAAASPGVALNRIRNAVAGSGIFQFFGTNGGASRQHFAFYGSGDVEYLSLGNGWVSSNVPTLRAVNAVLLQGNAFLSVRSVNSNFAIRRDELHLNYSQTVATAGTINDLAINADCKLLILTGATDLTGVVFVDNTRLLRIAASGVNVIIRDQSVSSTAANRFALGADLTINAGEVYQFIYTDSRWRRVL